MSSRRNIIRMIEPEEFMAMYKFLEDGEDMPFSDRSALRAFVVMREMLAMKRDEYARTEVVKYGDTLVTMESHPLCKPLQEWLQRTKVGGCHPALEPDVDRLLALLATHQEKTLL